MGRNDGAEAVTTAFKPCHVERTYVDRTIVLDGESFVKCEFTNCELLWAIGNYSLECCKLLRCRFPKPLAGYGVRIIGCDFVDSQPCEPDKGPYKVVWDRPREVEAQP